MQPVYCSTTWHQHQLALEHIAALLLAYTKSVLANLPCVVRAEVLGLSIVATSDLCLSPKPKSLSQ